MSKEPYHMASYKCKPETHNKCENSAMCFMCDGASHYKNDAEEKAAKREAAALRKQEQKDVLLRHHVKGKKEGMDFERRVQQKWNNNAKPKKAHAKPRLDMETVTPPSKRSTPALPSFLKKKPPATSRSVFGKTLARPSTSPSNGSSSPSSGNSTEAKRQPNSGAMWHSKGDIRVEHALMECKERGTVNGRGEKTISIPKEWMVKQKLEAFQEGKDFWYLPFGYKNDDEVYLIKSFDHEVEMIQEIRRLTQEIEELRAHLPSEQQQKGAPPHET